MIESCSTQRMLIGVIFLGGLTLLVLIVESHWTAGNTRALQHTVENNGSSVELCWLNEEYEVVEQCHPCTDFEVTSNSNKVCAPTHFKEAVNCKKSGKVYRSCEKVTWLEEKRFWQFEGLMILIGCVSTVSVYLRQRVLDYRTLRRIQRQIANSV